MKSAPQYIACIKGNSPEEKLWVVFTPDEPLRANSASPSIVFDGEVTLYRDPSVGTMCGGKGEFNPKKRHLTFKSFSGDVSFTGTFSKSFRKLKGEVMLNAEYVKGDTPLEFEANYDEPY
jgi:hypothetical protein